MIPQNFPSCFGRCNDFLSPWLENAASLRKCYPPPTPPPTPVKFFSPLCLWYLVSLIRPLALCSLSSGRLGFLRPSGQNPVQVWTALGAPSPKSSSKGWKWLLLAKCPSPVHTPGPPFVIEEVVAYSTFEPLYLLPGNKQGGSINAESRNRGEKGKWICVSGVKESWPNFVHYHLHSVYNRC